MSRHLTRFVGPFMTLTAAGVAAAVSGCSTTASTAGPGTTVASQTVLAPAISAPPVTPGPGESQGAFVFRTQCAGCHGTKGEGNLGPPLVGIAGRMSETDELARVRSGRGRMPPFSPALSDADIAAVVAYTRNELQ